MYLNKNGSGDTNSLKSTFLTSNTANHIQELKNELAEKDA